MLSRMYHRSVGQRHFTFECDGAPLTSSFSTISRADPYRLLLHSARCGSATSLLPYRLSFWTNDLWEQGTFQESLLVPAAAARSHTSALPTARCRRRPSSRASFVPIPRLDFLTLEVVLHLGVSYISQWKLFRRLIKSRIRCSQSRFHRAMPSAACFERYKGLPDDDSLVVHLRTLCTLCVHIVTADPGRFVPRGDLCNGDLTHLRKEKRSSRDAHILLSRVFGRLPLPDL